MCIHCWCSAIFTIAAVAAAAAATVSIAIVIIVVVALFEFISANVCAFVLGALVYSVHVFGIQLTTGMMANKWTHSKYILGRLAFCMWRWAHTQTHIQFPIPTCHWFHMITSLSLSFPFSPPLIYVCLCIQISSILATVCVCFFLIYKLIPQLCTYRSFHPACGWYNRLDFRFSK